MLLAVGLVTYIQKFIGNNMKEIVINVQTGEQTEIEVSAEELARRQQELDLLIANITYSQRRADAYPAFTEYLDGIVKGDQAQIQAYINQCLAVKAKYPKPE